MGVIAGAAVLVGGIISASMSRLLADEFKAWAPSIIERIVRRAVARLPRDEQERFGEEWRSHISEVPGEIGRIVVALGFIVAARRISSMLKTGREEVLVGDIFKRSVDVVMSLIYLVLVLPLLLLIALLVRLQGEGPVLFRAERIGLLGRRFAICRFCTVSRQRGPTKIGNFLTAAGWEKLPALMNIIRGEMSFVGPRAHGPHVAEQMSQILPRYAERCKVRPGLIGWAQLRGSSEPLVELADDLYYIEHRSLRLDGLILFRAFVSWARVSSPSSSKQ
jgi:lipopolysaccharide/colanic/teichoic acid biosynthesis glycosyltransferase